MMTRPEFFSIDRQLTDSRLEELKKELESGKCIRVGVSCLGHGHNNAVQEHVKRELESYYGDRLEIVSQEGYYSYSYTYKLK